MRRMGRGGQAVDAAGAVFLVLTLVLAISPYRAASAAPPESLPAAPGAQIVATPLPAPTSQPESALPYFPETGYWIGRPEFAAYFQQRGGVATFGYPTSRVFDLLGFPVQFFQRQVLQLGPDGSVRSLNLLDSRLMPYTTIQGSTLPAPDPSVIVNAPSPADSDYAARVVEFVERFAPDEWQGVAVNFGQAFRDTVRLDDAFPEGGGNAALLPLLALEIWGVPISRPQRDPNNAGFVYLRFQRGIMHFDVTHGLTQPLLMADYFKAILTGENLPADLAAQAADSPFLAQLRSSPAAAPDPAWPFAPESPEMPPTGEVLKPRYREPGALLAAVTSPPIQAETATPAGPRVATPVPPVATPTPTATATITPTVLLVTVTPTAIVTPVPKGGFGAVVAGLAQPQLAAAELRGIMDLVGVRWVANVPIDRPADLPSGYHVVEVLSARERPTVAQLRSRTMNNPGAYWLLDNEPNVPQMGNLTPAEYAEGLHHYATVLPQADPEARLVGPSILNFDYTCFGCGGFTLGQTWVDQLRSEYQTRYGMEPPFAVWSLHTYDLDWRPGRQPHVNWQVQARQLVRLRQYLDAVPALRGRPIWLTEFASLWGFGGFAITAEGCPAGANCLTPGDYPYETAAMTLFLEQFADWLDRNAARYNIERWFVFATHKYQDGWATQPNGMRLIDGQQPQGPLTPMGETYRNLAFRPTS